MMAKHVKRGQEEMGVSEDSPSRWEKNWPVGRTFGEDLPVTKYTLLPINLVLEMGDLASDILFITIYNYFIRKYVYS